MYCYKQYYTSLILTGKNKPVCTVLYCAITTHLHSVGTEQLEINVK